MTFVFGITRLDNHHFVIQFDATPVLANIKVLFGMEFDDTVDTLEGREKLAYSVLFSLTGDAAVAYRLREAFCLEKLNEACIKKSWMFSIEELQLWVDSVRAN